MMDRTNPVVLIADDEPGMLTLVAEHMKTLGHEVLEASDGEQAWTLAQDRLPDLVILDVMMPAMSGWEVCRKIRESVALAHTGIVMLTGMGENLNELTSPLYGADDYIDKPFEFLELDQKVRAVLAKRAAQRSAVPGLARTEPETESGASEPAAASEEKVQEDATALSPALSSETPEEVTLELPGEEPIATDEALETRPLIRPRPSGARAAKKTASKVNSAPGGTRAGAGRRASTRRAGAAKAVTTKASARKAKTAPVRGGSGSSKVATTSPRRGSASKAKPKSSGPAKKTVKKAAPSTKGPAERSKLSPAKRGPASKKPLPPAKRGPASKKPLPPAKRGPASKKPLPPAKPRPQPKRSVSGKGAKGRKR